MLDSRLFHRIFGFASHEGKFSAAAFGEGGGENGGRSGGGVTTESRGLLSPESRSHDQQADKSHSHASTIASKSLASRILSSTLSCQRHVLIPKETVRAAGYCRSQDRSFAQLRNVREDACLLAVVDTKSIMSSW